MNERDVNELKNFWRLLAELADAERSGDVELVRTCLSDLACSVLHTEQPPSRRRAIAIRARYGLPPTEDGESSWGLAYAIPAVIP